MKKEILASLMSRRPWHQVVSINSWHQDVQHQVDYIRMLLHIHQCTTTDVTLALLHIH